MLSRSLLLICAIRSDQRIQLNINGTWDRRSFDNLLSKMVVAATSSIWLEIHSQRSLSGLKFQTFVFANKTDRTAFSKRFHSWAHARVQCIGSCISVSLGFLSHQRCFDVLNAKCKKLKKNLPLSSTTRITKYLELSLTASMATPTNESEQIKNKEEEEEKKKQWKQMSEWKNNAWLHSYMRNNSIIYAEVNMKRPPCKCVRKIVL